MLWVRGVVAARRRLDILLGEASMGKLTTHILDTAGGVPAAGVRIELATMEERGERLLATATTNAGGRCDSPLLEGPAFVAGIYELRFAVGAYFSERTHGLPSPAFLDVVPVRFGVADPDSHYHVPLLISPFGYSTYRGS